MNQYFYVLLDGSVQRQFQEQIQQLFSFSQQQLIGLNPGKYTTKDRCRVASIKIWRYIFMRQGVEIKKIHQKALQLQKFTLFQNLNFKLIHAIFDLTKQHTYPYGKVLYSQGQKDRLIYFIMQGSVVINKRIGHKVRPLCQLNQLQVLGLDNLKDQLRRYSAVVNSNNCVISSVSIEDIIRKIVNYDKNGEIMGMFKKRAKASYQFFRKREEQLLIQLQKAQQVALDNGAYVQNMYFQKSLDISRAYMKRTRKNVIFSQNYGKSEHDSEGKKLKSRSQVQDINIIKQLYPNLYLKKFKEGQILPKNKNKKSFNYDKEWRKGRNQMELIISRLQNSHYSEDKNFVSPFEVYKKRIKQSKRRVITQY